jgi:hypothetical protein
MKSSISFMVSALACATVFCPSNFAAATPCAGADEDSAESLRHAIDAAAWTEELESVVAQLISGEFGPATDLAAAAQTQAVALAYLRAAARKGRLAFDRGSAEGAAALDISRLEFLVWLSYAGALATARSGDADEAASSILTTIELGAALETAEGGGDDALAAGLTLREAGYVQLQQMLAEIALTERVRRSLLRGLAQSRPDHSLRYTPVLEPPANAAHAALHPSADAPPGDHHGPRIAKDELDFCDRPAELAGASPGGPAQLLAAEAAIRRCHVETTYRATLIAVAANGYRADHCGALPGSLAALAPHYLKTLPHDPFSGGPFVYAGPEEGWLHSAGSDHCAGPLSRSPFDIAAPAYALRPLEQRCPASCGPKSPSEAGANSPVFFLHECSRDD